MPLCIIHYKDRTRRSKWLIASSAWRTYGRRAIGGAGAKRWDLKDLFQSDHFWQEWYNERLPSGQFVHFRKPLLRKLSKNQVLVYPLRPKGNVRDVILLLCVFEIRSCVQDGGIILYRWMPKSDRNYVHSSVENIGVRRM